MSGPIMTRAQRAAAYRRVAEGISHSPLAEDARTLLVARYLELADAVTAAAESEPVQPPINAAKPLARFFPDGRGPKPDPCKAAKGVWGRVHKGVI